ncbi:MAG: aminotransferase class I/II-fold pyridoxal phosphate-dependent enzyme [Helicobacter sp.]|nr:aminotransferase class I/II-fold pyridoxal phosphate-dependent enzyme [Helicobacteraceae bacterium]MDY3114137.1 aminotransferase class I/II-fold pyridoxal phosphate-dependent enzyme [Helicobacter sp.]
MQNQIKEILENLKKDSNYRTLIPQKHLSTKITLLKTQNLAKDSTLNYAENQKWLLNLANNDYLALAQDKEFLQKFLDSALFRENCLFSSTSSRLLSGNYEIYAKLEEFLKDKFNKEALLFNSGYHANLGALGALSRLKNTLFIADKSIHASHIDGLKSFNKVHFKRFSHNNTQELESLLQKESGRFESIVILSEGIFSIEGNFVPLSELVRLKKAFKNVYLYIDEAHSIGSFGENGLGICANLGLLNEVDFLVLTFGKAIASVGACVLCGGIFKEYFINTARSLIYSTALPPLNVAFSLFSFLELSKMEHKRSHLADISQFFKDNLKELNFEILGDYNIISLVLGENQRAVHFANELYKSGFFAPAIKYPTTPKNRALLRFSLNASMQKEELNHLIFTLKEIACKSTKI